MEGRQQRKKTFTMINIINRQTGLALDVEGGIPLHNGQGVVQWPFLGVKIQNWNLEHIESDDPSCVSICSANDNSKFGLTVNTSLFEVELWEYRGNDNQKWRLQEIEPGYFTLSPILFGNLSLEVADNGAELCNVCLSPSGIDDSQLWRLTPALGEQFSMFGPGENQKYSINYCEVDSKMLDILDAHGFCVVNNVLTEEDVLLAETSFGADLLTVCDKDKIAGDSYPPPLKAAWAELCAAPLRQVASIFPDRSVEAIAHSLPHGRFAWLVRLNERLRRLYEVLHHCGPDDLVVGFDQVFFEPRCSPGAPRSDVWPHSDHNTNDPLTADWRVYQSIAYVWPAETPNVATTVVWPGSHKEVHPQLMKHSMTKISTAHFVQLSLLTQPHIADEDSEEADPSLTVRQGRCINEQFLRQARRVPMTAGSVIVWDSRLIHQGWCSGARLALPVCWEPRERRDKKTLYRKMRMSALGLPSTHWASLGKKHNISQYQAHQPTAGYWNGKPADLRLPRVGSIFPACLKPPVGDQTCAALFQEIMSICEDLGASGDSSDEHAEKLKQFLKPEIVAAL